MPKLDLLLMFAGVVLSLMVFSYLLGDKLFFGVSMYLLVGVTTGYAAVVLIKRVLLPMLVMPLMDLPTVPGLLALVPLLLSLLLVWSLFKKSSKITTLPLNILTGILLAIAIFGITRGTLAPQLLSIVDAFDPKLVVKGNMPNWTAIFEAFMMLLGVISVLFFFHHRNKRETSNESPQPWLDGIRAVGQMFIGISFGAIFVGLFCTGLTALIATLERIIDFVRMWL
ncbi:MAG: hypothetical protein ACOYKC_00140 [Anaerolineaceae bacterium]|jgi:hypothetical protein